MEPWSILDIECTDDIAIIKKAYAGKLRIHHPEEDPQGYQRLRQAYDTALKYAKRRIEQKDRPLSMDVSANEACDTPSPILENSLTPPIPLRMEFVNTRTQNLPTLEEQNSDFMVQVDALYHDFFSRIHIENWKELLNSDIVWNIDNKRTLGRLLLDFLTSHRYLPQEIWILLDNNFHWCDHDVAIHSMGPDNILAYIQKQIKLANPPNYSFFKPTEGGDYDKYLEYRENAQKAFSENNFSATGLYVERAKNICPDDPDLLLLEGQLNLRCNNPDAAISIFSRLLGMNPNDTDAAFFRATAYYEKKMVRESLEDYSRVYSKSPDYKEIPLIMAKSYFNLGDYDKAKDWALKAQSIKSTYNEAKSLLSQIYAKLRSSLTKELEKDPSNKELERKLDAVNSEIFGNSGSHSAGGVNPEKVAKFLKITLKVILYTLLALVCLAAAFATKIGIIFVIYALVKHFNKKEG